MKALQLAYFYSPNNSPGARRAYYVGLELARAGDLYVLSSQEEVTKFDHAKEAISVNAPDLRSLSGVKTVSVRTAKSTVVSRLLPLRQAFPFLFVTDDGGPVYRRKAYQEACALIEKHGITTVFSSFRPWSDHLVAARLKKRFPAIRWIADFRDLPVDPVHQTIWWPSLQRWWGKRIIRSADEVWMVSEGQRQQMSGWHPNIKVRYNALADMPPGRTAPLSQHFTIAYTGSLYPDMRTPEKLVAALRSLLDAGRLDENKVRLVYRGKDDSYFRSFTNGLPECMLDVESSITADAAKAIQANAQLLLLLTWSAPGYYGVLTAKLWEYLSTGRPILALVKGPGDPELKKIIETAEAGAVFSDQESALLEKWLLENYEKWLEAGTLPWSTNRLGLKQYLV